MLSLLSFLPGACSDNIGSVNLPNELSVRRNNKSLQSDGIEKLIWSHDGISIKASGEKIVSDELLCQNDGNILTGIRISFDGWTDADTSSYISLLNIFNGEEVLLLESGGDQINRHHELFFNINGLNPLKFYIRLWCDEPYCTNASLKISNIRIYGL
jgi:hypothetical protein